MATLRVVNVQHTERWWPAELGMPATYGSTEHFSYASFPAMRRLLINQGGTCDLYDMGDFQFRGVLQRRGQDGAMSFLSQFGRIELARLDLISHAATTTIAKARSST